MKMLGKLIIGCLVATSSVPINCISINYNNTSQCWKQNNKQYVAKDFNKYSCEVFDLSEIFKDSHKIIDTIIGMIVISFFITIGTIIGGIFGASLGILLGMGCVRIINKIT